MLVSTGMDVGGAERVVLDLARAYVDAGLPTVVIVLNSDARSLLPLVDTSGLDIRFLGMKKSPAGLLRAARALAAIIRSNHVDLIHAHMPHAMFVASAARFMPGCRVPLVHTSHNFQFSRPLDLALRATRRLRDVDVLLAPGQHLALNAAQTATIPNGIRFPSTDPATDPATTAVPRAGNSGPVLLSVGRLTEQKDFATMIAAFAGLRRNGQDQGAVLRIAGDGPLRPALQAQIEALGLSDAVELLGIRKDIAALLSGADVFVMSSRFEGVPLAALEAGAAGLPIVAPPVGGLPWLLADDCGYLCAPEQLTQTLAGVLTDTLEARRRGARLRQRVTERFSLERTVADHLQLYQQLISAQ